MNDYTATKIGACFTGVCLLLTLTIVIPVFSMILGSLLEAVAKGLVDNQPYSNVGKLTILLLLIIFIVTFIIVLVRIRKTAVRISKVYQKKQFSISKKKIILILFLFYFIVHPLVFYIYWGVQFDFRPDGQLVMEAIKTFPISSILFIPIGIMMDVVKDWNL